MAAGRRFPLDPQIVKKIKGKDVLPERKFRMIADALNQLALVTAQGTPPRHAGSHKGGEDSLTARVLPTAITVGDGAIGNPAQGFATARHKHALSIADLISALEGAATSSDGVSISNPSLARLLALVLIEQIKINKVLSLRHG